MERRTKEHWLKLDGRRVFYRTLAPGPMRGTQPPLLFIHGISCCTETWDPFLRELGRREDAPAVVVPDLPAHGRSAKPPRLLGISDYAEWIAGFACELRLPRTDVMGHSMGGQIAIALAQRHPERVRRMVVVGPTTGGRHVSTLRSFAGLLADSTREPLSYNLLLTRVFWRMGPLRYLLTVSEMQRDDAFRRSREVTAPTLVLQGSRDAIIPKGVARTLAATLRWGEYAQVPGAAHAAQYSCPAATAQIVLGFLAASALRISA